MKAVLRLLVTVAATMALIAPALAADRAQGKDKDKDTSKASTAKHDKEARATHTTKKTDTKKANTEHATVRKDRPMPPPKTTTAQNHTAKPHQNAPKATPAGMSKGNKTGFKGSSTPPGQVKKTAAPAKAKAPEKHHRLSLARFHRGHKDNDKDQTKK